MSQTGEMLLYLALGRRQAHGLHLHLHLHLRQTAWGRYGMEYVQGHSAEPHRATGQSREGSPTLPPMT